MSNAEEMFQIVRAAFEPGADAAARERAAHVLRSALAALEPAPSAPPVPTAPGGADLLAALIAKFRPLAPAESIPRLNIPLVPVPRR